MAAYIVGQLRVKHWKWYPEYQAMTETLVEKHGGEYIVKSPEVFQFEGEGTAPDAVVVIRFPDAASAESWYRDSAYSPMIELRRSNDVETQLLLIKDA